MKIDKRLLMCAQLVEGDMVCDIGTDHGYLPAYLLESGKCSRAAAADINKMPLAAAENTLTRAGVMDKAKLYLSDGLKDVPLEGVTDIVIAGMGGELISRIISEDERTKSGINLILQPMTRAGVLRRAMAEQGFEAICEKGVSDGRFSYSVMKYRYSGKKRDITAVEENIGLLNGSIEEDRLYILRRIETMNSAAEGMKNSDKARADMLIQTISEIRKAAGL